MDDLLPPTPRQLEILKLLAEGYSREEIAGQLFIARSTVNYTLEQARGRLGARDVTHAVGICMVEGFLQIVEGKMIRTIVNAPASAAA